MFSGGGTLGPVVPLLAVAEIYKKHNPQAEFIWAGTQNGPEKEMIADYGLPFFTVMSGKLRRYISLWNFFDVFKLIFGFFQSLFLLWQEKPDLVVTAGGFVSAPVHLAAFVLGIPAWVHQQDFQAGLANKIMARTAKKVTTALRETQAQFAEGKTEWIGNPVRDLTPKNVVAFRQRLGIAPGAPVILAMGGGTGSSSINKLVMEALPVWPRHWHIIHLVGKERPRQLQENATKVFPNYHVFPFFKEEMKEAYAVADVVIARAGFATITELAALAKPAIFLPMAHTHQEVNAKLLADHQAAIVLDERVADGLKLAHVVKDLMEFDETRKYLGKRLHDILPAARPEKIVEIIESLVGGP